MSSSGNFLPVFGQESRQSAANRSSIDPGPAARSAPDPRHDRLL